MKIITTLLLLLTLLLSVLASCQGTVPTESLPQTRGTAPLTEEKKTEQKETLPQTKTEEPAISQPASTEEALMTLDQAKRILEKQLDAPKEKSDGSYEYLVREEVAQAIRCIYSNNPKDFYSDTQNTLYYRTYGVVLQEWFARLDQLILETKCAPIFEATVAFREDNGAYYPGKWHLYYFSDRGITKEYQGDVIWVAPCAFANNAVLESVIFTADQFEIRLGDNAFFNCPSLKTVSIPYYQLEENESNSYSLRIFSYCFDHHSSWDTLFMGIPGFAGGSEPATEEWALETLPIFQKHYQKEKLTKGIVDDNPANFLVKDGVLVAYVGIGGHVVIPEGVTEIRGNVFEHCKTNVLSVTFPSTLKKICTWALFGLPNVIAYQLPQGLELIEEAAFGLGTSQSFFFVTGIPEDCRVAEGAFPLDWMESYGRTHQELPEELKDTQKPKA